MPYVKRKAHYGNVSDLIDYIMNDDKTDDGLLVTGINCNAQLAVTQFNATRQKYHNRGKRTAYHLIQSFAPMDNITPEQAHEIGIRMCEELYPNFQCVVTTHIDRGHIHNHIAINSVNLSGRKLNDKTNDDKEGLYAARNKSDEISSEYGCYILPKTTFKFKSSNNKSEIYRYYKHKTWRDTIALQMKELKFKCKSLDEFIIKLFELGYDVKFGKYIAIKLQGKERYVRLKTIGEEYSEENLRLYFEGKSPLLKNASKEYEETEFNKRYVRTYREIQACLLVTTGFSAKNSGYPKFQDAIQKTMSQSSKIQALLDVLQAENINSFDDLQNKIEGYNEQIYEANKEIKKIEKQNKSLLERIEKAQEFIFLTKEYKYVEYYKSLDSSYTIPEEMKYYEKIRDELGITSIDEAKQIIIESSGIRKQINSLRSEVYDLQQKLFRLDLMKEKELLKSDLFIHNIKVGNNRIDYKNSTKDRWCIELPYSRNTFVFIDKKLSTFNHKYGYNTLFLINDKKYDIYVKDDEGKLVKDTYLSGEQLDRLVADLKKENTQKHKEENINFSSPNLPQ